MIRATFCALAFATILAGSTLSHAAPESYLIGCGSADITGPAAGFPMEGFVKQDQTTEGIHLRQRVRAFIIAQPDEGTRIVFVCAELCKFHAEIHNKVMARLKRRYGDLYRVENVILSATHTHSGAGGHWRYAADTAVGSGFFPEYQEAIVDGIESAVVASHENLQPGQILVARGEVEEASAQRSRIAYVNNPKKEREQYSRDVDTEMLLLKFVGGPSGEKDLGTLNWFAVHPTSMTFNNHFITGDCKGYASTKFERRMRSTNGDDQDFVAAFAQSNCGDVTGNLNLNNTGPGRDDFESTQIIGQRQLDVAWRLYEQADERLLAGPIDVRHAYVDFSQLPVEGEFTGCGPKITSVAAYGYAFAAGSTEDGGGHPLFREGMKQRNTPIDLLSYQMFPDYQPDDRIRQLHYPKAILFAPGVAKSNVGLAQVLPLSVVRIGQLVLVVGPAEFTTMSGRRIRRSVREAFGELASDVVLAGYSNAYGGYVSTQEEYEMQQYEGGHTLFGPWTLAGYQQEYVRLARAMVEGVPAQASLIPADDPVPVKLRPIRLGPDQKPADADFGDIVVPPKSQYTAGDRVEAEFWTGHPRNTFHTEGNFFSVQQQSGSEWTTIYTDADWETRCRWQPSRNAVEPCRVTLSWDVPDDQEPGVYRLLHHGRYQLAEDSQPQKFQKRYRSIPSPIDPPSAKA